VSDQRWRWREGHGRICSAEQPWRKGQLRGCRAAQRWRLVALVAQQRRPWPGLERADADVRQYSGCRRCRPHPGQLRQGWQPGGRRQRRGNLYHYWRDDGGTWKWHANGAKPAAPFATGVVGVPSLIQSSHGTRGNFEVVAPLAGGGLAHWWRDNDSASLTWHGPTRFGSGSVRASALLQSNFGPVATWRWWRSSATSWSIGRGTTARPGNGANRLAWPLSPCVRRTGAGIRPARPRPTARFASSRGRRTRADRLDPARR
jgi:hypothetical protein